MTGPTILALHPDSIKTSSLSDPEVRKLSSCSTQLSMKFILFINVKMPTIVEMTGVGDLNLKIPSILAISIFMSSVNFILS